MLVTVVMYQNSNNKIMLKINSLKNYVDVIYAVFEMIKKTPSTTNTDKQNQF